MMRPTRKKPAPFKRPSIDIGKHGREWKEVMVCDLEIGDIVAGKGLVVDVRYVPGSADVELTFSNGEVEQYWGNIGDWNIVKAFINTSDD